MGRDPAGGEGSGAETSGTGYKCTTRKTPNCLHAVLLCTLRVRLISHPAARQGTFSIGPRQHDGRLASFLAPYARNAFKGSPTSFPRAIDTIPASRISCASRERSVETIPSNGWSWSRQ